MTTDPHWDALQAGFRHHRSGQLREAEAIYRQVLAQNPDHPEAMHLLGLIACQVGAFNEGIDLLRRSIDLKPSVQWFYKNLGEMLRSHGDLDGALRAFAKAVEMVPTDAEAVHCMGLVHEKAGRFEESMEAYRHALELKPDHAPSDLNLGVLIERQGRYEEAMRYYDRALEIRPDYPIARMARAVALLRQGRYEEGWRDYEWRWRTREFASRTPDPHHPIWDGSELGGRTILLRWEQGMGDTLQFIRYAPMVAKRGGRVMVEAQTPLKSLISRVEGVAGVFATGEALPEFDVQAMILGLPQIFGTTPENIPAGPYLAPDPARVEAWRQRLAGDRSFKVGLVWAGSPNYPNDRNRSIPLKAFAPLAGVSGVSFYSLQKDDPGGQAADPPEGMRLVDLTADLTDFTETAGLVQSLDLVISVDTAMVHLAGGMGKAVWTLVPFVPDFRWMLGREDTPWYPSMRLLRQPAIGDWETPIRRAAEELASLQREHSKNN